MATKSMRNRVLIVDDDPMVLESLDMLFTHYGWDVVTAASGDDVLDALRPIDYELALIDQRMDGATGIDVIRELKSRSAAPVFMLTGCVDPGLRASALAVGADRYFDKPVDARILIKALEEL